MENLILFCKAPKQIILTSFWYIDLQISNFNQIPYGISFIKFFPLINMPTFLAVVLWQIRTETLEAWGANSHFPVPCHPYLGASGQLYLVFNCPLLADRVQTQQNRILKLE